jgi:hypothetical protein
LARATPAAAGCVDDGRADRVLRLAPYSQKYDIEDVAFLARRPFVWSCLFRVRSFHGPASFLEGLPETVSGFAPDRPLMDNPHRTKSRYLAEVQCPRRLWLLVNDQPNYDEPPGSPLEIGYEFGQKTHLLLPFAVLATGPASGDAGAEASRRIRSERALRRSCRHARRS